MTLPRDAQRIAEAQAARDRDTLARLLREGKVRREAEAAASAFTRDIEERAWPRRQSSVNLAIRPKKGKRR